MERPTLPTFAAEAHERVRSGYYAPSACPEPEGGAHPSSLRAALLDARGTLPLIAELKPASPTRGDMRRALDAAALARAFVEAGARAVSVLAEPARFGGSPGLVAQAASCGAPVLWKDFVVSTRQLEAAAHCGASAVLLILDLHEDGLADGCVESFVAHAHDLGLETLLEVYDAAGLARALETGTDLVGVNARDLRAPGLPIDADAFRRALDGTRPDRPVLALSGVSTRADIERHVREGAAGVLVGSALMEAADPAARLHDLVA